MGSLNLEDIDFTVLYIFRNVKPGWSWRTLSPIGFFVAIIKILRSRSDLVIVSLWRSSIVGLIAKMLSPRMKLITFLHSSRDEHSVDKWLTRMAIKQSVETWADSKATLDQRAPGVVRNGRVISFVIQRSAGSVRRYPFPTFIYWGRLSAEKGLQRALGLFGAIRKVRQDADLLIIGPDNGELAALRKRCETLGLADCVTLFGPSSSQDILGLARSRSFYLQTSLYEGMAMSVVEAMQLGLVPIVTAVGEIGSYCVDGKNAVIVTSDERAITEVLDLLADSERFARISANAIATWQDKPLYSESVIEACRKVTRHGSTEPANGVD